MATEHEKRDASRAVEEAVSAYLTAHGRELIAGVKWVLVGVAVDINCGVGESVHFQYTNELPIHETFGLLHYATIREEARIRALPPD